MRGKKTEDLGPGDWDRVSAEVNSLRDRVDDLEQNILVKTVNLVRAAVHAMWHEL